MGVFRVNTTQYRTDDDRVVPKGTPGARKVRVKSRKWYGEYRDRAGRRVRVPLSEDKTEAIEQLSRLREQAGESMAPASEVLARAATEFLDLRAKRGALFAPALERGYVDWGKVSARERRERAALEDALVLQAVVNREPLAFADWGRVWVDARTTDLPARTVGAIIRIVAKRRYKVHQFGVERSGQTVAIVFPRHVGDLEPFAAEIASDLRSRRVLEVLGKRQRRGK